MPASSNSIGTRSRRSAPTPRSPRSVPVGKPVSVTSSKPRRHRTAFRHASTEQTPSHDTSAIHARQEREIHVRDIVAHDVWDTWPVSVHLWGMVAELSTSGLIPGAPVPDAIAGDTMAFARIVRANHDDMVRVCQLICGDAEL